MSAEKTSDTTIREDIKETLEGLKVLRSQGYETFEMIELIEVAKLNTLSEISNELIALDHTLVEIGVCIDVYAAERIESDKVIVGLMRAINKDKAEPDVDQEPDVPEGYTQISP